MVSPIISSARSTGIHPGTFYNWVSGFSKKAYCEIFQPISKVEHSPVLVQEVVRLNFNSKGEKPEPMHLCQPALASSTRITDISARIEISLGNATIRIANDIDPAIRDRVLSLMKGTVC